MTGLNYFQPDQRAGVITVQGAIPSLVTPAHLVMQPLHQRQQLPKYLVPVTFDSFTFCGRFCAILASLPRGHHHP